MSIFPSISEITPVIDSSRSRYALFILASSPFSKRLSCSRDSRIPLTSSLSYLLSDLSSVSDALILSLFILDSLIFSFIFEMADSLSEMIAASLRFDSVSSSELSILTIILFMADISASLFLKCPSGSSRSIRGGTKPSILFKPPTFPEKAFRIIFFPSLSEVIRMPIIFPSSKALRS